MRTVPKLLLGPWVLCAQALTIIFHDTILRNLQISPPVEVYLVIAAIYLSCYCSPVLLELIGCE